jgi:hypothetical protein
MDDLKGEAGPLAEEGQESPDDILAEPAPLATPEESSVVPTESLSETGSATPDEPAKTDEPAEEEEIKPRYEAPQADLSEPSEEVVVLPAAIVERPTAPEEDEAPLFTLSDMLAAAPSTPNVEPPLAPSFSPEPTPVLDEEEIIPLDFSLHDSASASRPLDPATLGPMTRRELKRPHAIDLGAMNRPPKPETPAQTPVMLEEEANPLVPILQTIDYSGARPGQEATSPEKESLLDFDLPLLNTPAIRQVNRHNVDHEEQNNILSQIFWTLVIIGIALVIAYFFGGAILAFAQNFLHNPGKAFNDLVHSLTHIFGF